MSPEPHSKQADPADVPPEKAAAAKAVGAWVQQFARTLKNCRLYEANNSVVLRFRQQLAAALHELVREHGAFSLRFGSDDVTYEGASLYPARSRDDNLALPFYRDGIRSLTFGEKVEPAELAALIAALIQVTGQAATGDDDLVTLLWEAQLEHIEIDYVPPEGDVAAPAGAQEGELVPWPTAAAEPEAADPASRTVVDPPPGEDQEPRSDDWSVGQPTSEFEATFAALAIDSTQEVGRFIGEYEAERAVAAVPASVALARAFLSAEAGPEDVPELGRYLPRVLRGAIQEGLWAEARESLRMIRESGEAWSPVTFAQELQQPVSMAAITQRLEQQTQREVEAFAAFAGDLGDLAVDTLGQVVAEMAASPRLKPLAAALVNLCRTNPERLTPWLSDRRSAVVRNTVQMLSTIGGGAIGASLQIVMNHPDPRVRAEALGALKGVEAKAAKPLLMPLLRSTDTRQFCAAVQKLSEARDREVAEALLLLLVAAEFEHRPAEEKHAIYFGLGATGGDEVIPELEAELLKGGWFGRGNDAHRQAVARCIVRIGTPMARMVLEHGVQSRKVPIRDTCREMLLRWEEIRG